MGWIHMHYWNTIRKVPMLRRACIIYHFHTQRICIYILLGTFLILLWFTFYRKPHGSADSDFAESRPLNGNKFQPERLSLRLDKDRHSQIQEDDGRKNEETILNKLYKAQQQKGGSLPYTIKPPVFKPLIPIKLEADDEWVQMRQRLLNETRERKVLLYNYHLDGASLLQSMLNSDKRTVIFPQALDPFYSANLGYPAGTHPLDLIFYWNSTTREMSEAEQTDLAHYLSTMYSCELSSLPPEMMFSPGLLDSQALKALPACVARSPGRDKASSAGIGSCKTHLHHHCGYTDPIHRNTAITDSHNCYDIIRNVRKIKLGRKSPFEVYNELDKNNQASVANVEKLENFMKHDKCALTFGAMTRDCAEFGERVCRHYKLRVAAVNRIGLTHADWLFKFIPDLQIIYFVRDPRWETSKRVGNPKHTWNPFTVKPEKEALILCKRMREDVMSLVMLKKKYPNAILTLRYEDLIENLGKVSGDVYKWLGFQKPSSLEPWILETLDTEVACRDEFGPYKCPPNLYTKVWRQLIDKDVFNFMTARCQDVLEYLGYGLLS